MHQQFVICLINTCVLPVNMAVNSVRRGFLCNNKYVNNWYQTITDVKNWYLL